MVVGYHRSIGQACQSSAAGELLNTPGARVENILFHAQLRPFCEEVRAAMVSGSMLANVGCQHDHPGDVGGGYMHETPRCSGQTLQIVLKGAWVTILGCFHFSGEGEKKRKPRI